MPSWLPFDVAGGADPPGPRQRSQKLGGNAYIMPGLAQDQKSQAFQLGLFGWNAVAGRFADAASSQYRDIGTTAASGSSAREHVATINGSYLNERKTDGTSGDASRLHRGAPERDLPLTSSRAGGAGLFSTRQRPRSPRPTVTCCRPTGRPGARTRTPRPRCRSAANLPPGRPVLDLQQAQRCKRFRCQGPQQPRSCSPGPVSDHGQPPTQDRHRSTRGGCRPARRSLRTGRTTGRHQQRSGAVRHALLRMPQHEGRQEQEGTFAVRHARQQGRAARGFVYSDALRNSQITWTADALSRYIANPGDAVPGGKMKYDGLESASERNDLDHGPGQPGSLLTPVRTIPPPRSMNKRHPPSCHRPLLAGHAGGHARPGRAPRDPADIGRRAVPARRRPGNAREQLAQVLAGSGSAWDLLVRCARRHGRTWMR